MRVVSGIYRGKKLLSPLDEKTRPTSDKVKEALFTIISPYILDSVCLDLFSGSGALGIEAISRGAKKVIFNDSNKNACKIIKSNLESLKDIPCEFKLYQEDYLSFLNKLTEPINILFLDPPYALKVNEEIIDLMLEKKLFLENSLICVETSKEDSLKNREIYSSFKEYKYGLTKLTIIKLK